MFFKDTLSFLQQSEKNKLIFCCNFTSTFGNFYGRNLDIILPITDVVAISDFKSETFNSFENVMLIIYALL